MQLVPRICFRLQASRAFHTSLYCTKQELFKAWKRPLNKAQLKVIYKAKMRNNPRCNSKFQQDAATLLHEAYSRTKEEHHFDGVTLQQLRDIVQECAGDRFDVVDISTHTYALPLRNQPAEFLIVDSKYPNGRSPEVEDEYSIMYDADGFMAVLEKHGFKCFGQHVSKKRSDNNDLTSSEHGKSYRMREGYEAPMTLHVGRSIGRPIGMDGHHHPPISSLIPSISFSLTLPHPAVLPLNKLLRTYFRFIPEIPQVWALALLWVRSLGLGTSAPGMDSANGIRDPIQYSGRQDIVSKSSPYAYVEELSPTCLALLFIVHLVEAKLLPNLFGTEPRHVVLHENEPQSIWVPYTYRSSPRRATQIQTQAIQQKGNPSCDAENTLVTRGMAAYSDDNWVQTSTQIDTTFALPVIKQRDVKFPKIVSLFFEYLSACAESRRYYYSLRKGARVQRDVSSRSQLPRCQIPAAQKEFAKRVSRCQRESWKLDRLVVQDPFISTYNHAAFVSDLTLHRITQCAKTTQKRIVRGRPLWAMFGSHLELFTAPSTSRIQDNCRNPAKSHVTETASGSPGTTNPIRERPPHLRENLRSSEKQRMQAKPTMSERVAGNSHGSPSLKPVIHRRPFGTSQPSRGVHTNAARPPLGNKTAEETVYETENDNSPRIAVNFPQVGKKFNNREMTNAKAQLIRKVRHVVKDKYGPRYDVQPYGSSVYMVGHGSDGSDLDLVVLDSKWPQGFTPEMDMKHLPLIYDTRKLARTMRYVGFTNIVAIPWARVPIVKFTDPASGLNVDINVNEKLGLLNTNLVKTYCDAVPCLRYLLSAIKEWARPRALNDPSGAEGLRTFSSYALVLMTIAWLQSRDLAPKLQAGLPSMEADDEHLFWMRPSRPSKRIPCDTRYFKSTTWMGSSASPGLENLVEQWFRFWAGFQFPQHVIDIKRGGIYPRIHHFEDVTDDNNRGPRIETRRNWSAFMGPDIDSTTMLESNAISVVDPFIRSKNVTKGIDARGLKLFQAECENASELLRLGANTTDIIDRFDLIKQDFDGYRKAGPRHVRPGPGSHGLKEIDTPKLGDDVVQKFNAIDHWSPPGPGGPKTRWMPLSDALGSSGAADEGDGSPTRDMPQEVRDDEEEGFGLKESYFKQHR